MKYKLISCSVSGPIERVRGADQIPINVLCTFETPKGHITMPGVGLTVNPSTINVAIQDGIKEAEQNLLKYHSEESGVPNPALAKVVRQMIAPQVQTKLKGIGKSELDKMYEVADAEKQQRITDLCEALGIDIIDIVSDQWTNVEIMLLATYLEKLTEPLTGGY